MPGHDPAEIKVPAELRALFDRLHAELAVVHRMSSASANSPAAAQILQHPTPRDIVACAIVQRAIEVEQAAHRSDWEDYNSLARREHNRLVTTLSQILPAAVADAPVLLDSILQWWSAPKSIWFSSQSAMDSGLLSAIEHHARQHPITPVMRDWLVAIRERWQRGHKPDHRKIARINTLLGDELRLEIDPGEAWSDRAIADIAQCPPPAARAWAEFIHHCRIASTSTPGAKWLKDATRLLAGIGHPALTSALISWFPLVDRPRTAPQERRNHWDPDLTHRIIDAHMEILKGLPFSQTDEPHELITPTGAALFAEFVSRVTPWRGLRVERVGYGLGTRELRSRPNVLRAVLAAPDAAAEHDEVSVLESNLDDCPPEVIGDAIGRLLEAGALDAYAAPVSMKKSRPGVLLGVLCRPEDAARLGEMVLRLTTAFGVRETRASRRVLRREWIDVPTPYGDVSVKVGFLGSDRVQAMPEYESCREVAEASGAPLRAVWEAAFAAART